MEKVVSEKLVYNDNDIIGKGIAGFVFRGSFGDDKIPVAVKRVKLACVNKEAVQKRGEDTLKGLDHENVVKLFHVEQDEVYRSVKFIVSLPFFQNVLQCYFISNTKLGILL